MKEDVGRSSCTYVGLYGSGLIKFVSYVSLPNLFACFLGFDIPTSSFIFIETVFIFLVMARRAIPMIASTGFNVCHLREYALYM